MKRIPTNLTPARQYDEYLERIPEYAVYRSGTANTFFVAKLINGGYVFRTDDQGRPVHYFSYDRAFYGAALSRADDYLRTIPVPQPE